MSDEKKNSQSEKSQDKKSKKKKPKGPLRTEAIVPAFFFFVLVVLYTVFFFDSHLRRSLELAASYTYGAEVDIGDLNISWSDASLRMSSLDVTDYDQPERNLVSIEEILVALEWDALLRAKFVVNDAAINGIGWQTPRSAPGKIYREKGVVSQGLQSAEDQVLENTQENFSGNVLGDAASLLSGNSVTDQLSDVKGELATKKKIDQLQGELRSKEKQWQKRLAELPDQARLKAMTKEFESLRWNTKNPAQLAQDIKKGSNLIRQGDGYLKTIDREKSSLLDEVRFLQDEVKSIEKLREQDIRALQQRVKIPQLDTKSLAMMLFGQQINDYRQRFGHYFEIVRDYLPTESANTEEGGSDSPEPTPKDRALGKNYEFPTKTSYPVFWLKQAALSSSSKNSEFSGDLQGKLTHLTTNQKQIDQPTRLELTGSFPQKKVRDLQAEITIDHRGEKKFETIQAQVGSYPVDRQTFSESDDVKFGFDRAIGSLTMNGRLEGRNLKMQMRHRFQNIQYFSEAKADLLDEALKNVTRDVPVITVDSNLSGFWRSPGITLRTNLARAIEASLRQQLNAKVNDAKKQISELVEKQIGSSRQALDQSLQSATGGHLKTVNDLDQQVKSLKKDFQTEIDKAKNSKTKELEQKAKEGLDKLRKKFNF